MWLRGGHICPHPFVLRKSPPGVAVAVASCEGAGWPNLACRLCVCALGMIFYVFKWLWKMKNPKPTSYSFWLLLPRCWPPSWQWQLGSVAEVTRGTRNRIILPPARGPKSKACPSWQARNERFDETRKFLYLIPEKDTVCSHFLETTLTSPGSAWGFIKEWEELVKKRSLKGRDKKG